MSRLVVVGVQWGMRVKKMTDFRTTPMWLCVFKVAITPDIPLRLVATNTPYNLFLRECLIRVSKRDGNGMVINPKAALIELDGLKSVELPIFNCSFPTVLR